jgi:hypothetical protein
VFRYFYNADTGELVDIDADNLKIDGLPPLPDGTQAENIELMVHTGYIGNTFGANGL